MNTLRSSPQEIENLRGNYQALLENGKFNDVIFVVDGKEFQLHKSILAARSPVFAVMLKNDFDEKKRGKVELPDISSDAFEELLRYIYSGVIPDMDQFALELFEAADKVGFICYITSIAKY